MLGAILCQHRLEASGPAHGIGPTTAGTAWNPNWAQDYGPDCDRAKKADREECKKALVELKKAPDMEPIEAAQTIARRSLVSDLMENEKAKVDVMTAYYAYKRWQKKQNGIKATLLLM